MHINFHQQTFILDGRRALFWLEKSWLLLADVHWGKTHFFQKHGLSVGHGVFRADLKRLEELIKDYQPDLILCLGDLIHHEAAMGKELLEEIGQFRDQNPTPLTLIRGNHERYIKKLPLEWGIDIVDEKIHCDGITLCHEKEAIPSPQIYGHLHPKINLKGQGDNLSLPCFYQREKELILPAFSEFCGGVNIDLKKGEKSFLCLSDPKNNSCSPEVVSFP